MAVTLNSIKVDFGLGATPPRVTFQQGANMDVFNIRDTLREIEESSEARDTAGAASPGGKGFICDASGNNQIGSETGFITVAVLPPFKVFFDPGATPYQTSNGNLSADFIESPGAIVQVNNKVGGINDAERLTQLWQDRGFDAANPVTVNESAGTISVAGTIRTWTGSLIKTLTRTT